MTDRITDAVAEATADALVGPQLPTSPSFIAYRFARFDMQSIVSNTHPKAVSPGAYVRRRVAAGRAFGGVR